ncbi:hypothetical protein [Brevundimonas diminuta]|uniref:hypothetical protein n=1 Tax=Brevundimonas diminuta TaxID=293 RepID=UPI0030FD02ED
MAAALIGTGTSAQAQDCNMIFASLSEREDSQAAASQDRPRRGFFSQLTDGARNLAREHGAVIGSVTGAVLANQVCDRTGSGGGLCRVLLAGGGALLGDQISRALVEDDQRRLLVEAHQTILDGRPRTLALPESNACARTTVADATEQLDLPVTLAFAPEVASPARLAAVGLNHETTVRAAVRTQPSTTGTAVTTLPVGSPLLLMGHLPDRQDWSLVGQGGVAIGYVQTQQLRASHLAPPEWSGAGNTRLAEVTTSMTCRSSTNAVASSDGRSLGSVTARGCAGPEGLPIAA